MDNQKTLTNTIANVGVDVDLNVRVPAETVVSLIMVVALSALAWFAIKKYVR